MDCLAGPGTCRETAFLWRTVLSGMEIPVRAQSHEPHLLSRAPYPLLEVPALQKAPHSVAQEDTPHPILATGCRIHSEWVLPWLVIAVLKLSFPFADGADVILCWSKGVGAGSPHSSLHICNGTCAQQGALWASLFLCLWRFLSSERQLDVNGLSD